jgi:hypothetical protein
MLDYKTKQGQKIFKRGIKEVHLAKDISLKALKK